MIDRKSLEPLPAESVGTYEIKVKGYLEGYWSDWLGGLEITQDEHGHSLLRGFVPDQAALYGILMQIRDLGLTLVSLKPQSVGLEKNSETN